MNGQLLKVLLIEDNPGDARLIREMLGEVAGPSIDVEHIDRLAVGLNRLGAGDIDTLLLDLGLPDSPREETFARTHALAPRLPIILLTGTDDEEMAIRMMREGAQDYLVKGHLDGNLLVRAIRYAVERKRAEDEIRCLNESLEQRVAQRTEELAAANRDLESFIYSVSHDLRAPLRHMDGFAKILAEEHAKEISPEALQALQRVREGTQRMGLLLDDLLRLARIGRQELNQVTTGLGSLLEETLDDLKAETSGRAIEWRIGPLPFVECDPGLVKQVFANLLANAIKFTRPRPTAVIEVGHRKENGEVVVFVKDNGVGFNPRYADKAFGVFQRLHRVEEFPGSGTGLAIVQRIVRKHGGRVWAEADVDRGATFYFTLSQRASSANGSPAHAVISGSAR